MIYLILHLKCNIMKNLIYWIRQWGDWNWYWATDYWAKPWYSTSVVYTKEWRKDKNWNIIPNARTQQMQKAIEYLWIAIFWISIILLITY